MGGPMGMIRSLSWLSLIASLSCSQALADENSDLEGIWIANIGSSVCMDFTSASKDKVVKIKRDENLYTIEANKIYSNVVRSGNSLNGSHRPTYSTKTTWEGVTPSPQGFKELNSLRLVDRIELKISDDEQTLYGEETSGVCATFTFLGNLQFGTQKQHHRRVTYRRVDPDVFFVKENWRGDYVKANRFTLDEKVRIAAGNLGKWPEQSIRPDQVVWSDGREEKVIRGITLEKSATNPSLFVSKPFVAASPMIENTRIGFRSLGTDGTLIWARRGAVLAATLFGDREVKTSFTNSILEAIMETTTAILLFVMLAFIVERLTNGLAMIVSYLKFWGKYFEAALGNEELTERNLKNRRIVLFLLGIGVGVPLCIYFEFDLFSQLQLAQLPELGGQIGTGLLAGCGADPLRELATSNDGKMSLKLARGRGGGGPGNIKVEAHLIVPEGAIMQVSGATSGSSKLGLSEAGEPFHGGSRDKDGGTASNADGEDSAEARHPRKDDHNPENKGPQ